MFNYEQTLLLSLLAAGGVLAHPFSAPQAKLEHRDVLADQAASYASYNAAMSAWQASAEAFVKVGAWAAPDATVVAVVSSMSTPSTQVTAMATPAVQAFAAASTSLASAVASASSSTAAAQSSNAVQAPSVGPAPNVMPVASDYASPADFQAAWIAWGNAFVDGDAQAPAAAMSSAPAATIPSAILPVPSVPAPEPSQAAISTPPESVSVFVPASVPASTSASTPASVLPSFTLSSGAQSSGTMTGSTVQPIPNIMPIASNYANYADFEAAWAAWGNSFVGGGAQAPAVAAMSSPAPAAVSSSRAVALSSSSAVIAPTFSPAASFLAGLAGPIAAFPILSVIAGTTVIPASSVPTATLTTSDLPTATQIIPVAATIDPSS